MMPRVFLKASCEGEQRLFNKIRTKINYRLNKYLINLIQTKNKKVQPAYKFEYEKKLDSLKSFYKKNNASVIKIETFPVEGQNQYKWVGGQVNENDDLFGIVNGATKVLKFSNLNQTIEYFGELPPRNFKWTGGCFYNKSLYGFPRSANELLKVDVEQETTQELKLGLNYRGEHHYGGVLTRKGIVYQPPRNTDHILAIDLNTLRCRRIPLAPQWKKIKFRYCGSVLHPNGFVYFLPEFGERVIKFDPDTEEFAYIGSALDCMVFDAAIAPDGNIYGYSAYSHGLLKIDVMKDTTEMAHQELLPGCYGTKLGPNGKLYGIPGDGNDFLEYDVENDRIDSIGRAAELGNAKCAGGAVDHFGNIYCVPALGSYLYKIRFNGIEAAIPKDLYDDFFVDCY